MVRPPSAWFRYAGIEAPAGAGCLIEVVRAEADNHRPGDMPLATTDRSPTAEHPVRVVLLEANRCQPCGRG